MVSIAARTTKKARHLILKGTAPLAAWNEALEGYAVETKEHRDEIYARFTDGSYAQIRGRFAYTITSNVGKFEASKIIDGIYLLCEECSAALWCDRGGRGRPSETYGIAGTEVHVCIPCQRKMVTRVLLGE